MSILTATELFRAHCNICKRCKAATNQLFVEWDPIEPYKTCCKIGLVYSDASDEDKAARIRKIMAE